MAKFVEQGDHIIPRDKRWLTFSRFLIVADVVDHRPRPGFMGLLDKVAHPRPAAFGVAGEEVTVKERHPFSVVIENLPDSHIRVVDRDILALGKRNAEKPGRRPEDAVGQHPVESKIGFNL